MKKGITTDEYLQGLTSENGVSCIRNEFGYDRNKDMKMLDVLLRNAYDHLDDLKSELNATTDENKIKIIKEKMINIENYINHHSIVLECIEKS